MNTGDLIPIFCTDILPGDTMKMNTSHVVRMMTPITPVMDNAVMDTYFSSYQIDLCGIIGRSSWAKTKQHLGHNRSNIQNLR